ncbi:MAG: polysaccharide deacetylase family protein [Caldisericia bacterium]|jgi:peptidoglycan/xylan/chitin deacetylase (PgdA/CDA1 family)|nr:polysaccharide deacetylase family protein [Caldisericia bacterium]
MKKFILGGVILFLLLPFFSCNLNSKIDFNFIFPQNGDYVTKGELIIVEFSDLKNINELKLLLLGDNFKKDLLYEIKENRLYSSFPRDISDGEYILNVVFYIKDKYFKKEIKVILNSEIPIWENIIYPIYVRSGREITIESISSTPLKEVKAIFDDGTILNLNYLNEKDLWQGKYIISNFINEGSHIIKFEGIDLKGDIIEDTKVLYVINSDPVIYSPIDGLETTTNEITIFGFYEQDKNIIIYLNDKPYKEIKVEPSGNFYSTLFLLPGNYKIFAKDPQSQFLGISSLQNINLKIFNEGVIVLCYHNVSDKGGNLYTISPEEFENQIKYMIEKGYTSITIDDLYDYYFNGKSIPKKSVLITFDDGLKGVYEFAYPILKKYGFKATFFVIVSRVGRVSSYVDWDNLKEMVNSGVFSIGSHTFDSHRTHISNGKFVSIISQKRDDEDFENFKNRVVEDLKKSKEEIEKNIQKKTISFAYPYGEYSKDTVEFLKESGFIFGFTTYKGINIKSISKYELKRYSIYRSTDIKQIIN